MRDIVLDAGKGVPKRHDRAIRDNFGGNQDKVETVSADR